MAKVLRVNRKADDFDVVRMNNLGLSLRTIGAELGVHPTSVAARLRNLNIEPADTRRSFMEDVFRSLSGDEQSWLADQLNQNHQVKDYVILLIRDKYKRDTNVGTAANNPVVQAGQAGTN